MDRNICKILVLFLALPPLAATTGCGNDDNNDGDTDGTAIDTQIMSACDTVLLSSVWLSNRYSVEFFDDLSYRAAGAPNLMTIHVTGQATVDGCTLSLTDEGGVYACPSGQVGVYEFSVDDETLSLTLVDDPCPGRSTPLDGAVLERGPS